MEELIKVIIYLVSFFILAYIANKIRQNKNK